MADVSTTFDNILAYWELDEASGTRFDSSPNANHLTDNNTVGQITTAIGDAADFERSNNEYLSRASADLTGLKFTGDHTLMFWTTLESLSSTLGIAQAIIGRDDTGDRCYYLEVHNTANRLRYLYWDNGGSLTRAEATTSLATGTLYCCVVRVDVSAASIEIKINDVDQTIVTLNSSANSVRAGGQDFNLGHTVQTTTKKLDGSLQKVLILGDLATDEECTTFYNAGAGIDWESGITPDPAAKNPLFFGGGI